MTTTTPPTARPGSFPTRPFRFGVQANAIASRAEWVDLARRVETLGYATLTMPDHFDAQLAPVPALQCAADATTSLRLGALVYDNDYRHPVVLAKELATMDVLSDGRVEVGLGAGWMISDYEQSGIPYDSAGVRVDRMIEGLAVIQGAFGPGPYSFSGEHYTITEYDGLPKPVQAHPPVLIGGGGPRVLKFAARHADIVGINATLTSGKIDAATLATLTADEVDRKQSWVFAAADEVDRAGQIELNVRAFMVQVVSSTSETDTAYEAIASMLGLDVTAIRASPYALVGTPDKLIDDLQQRRERWGFSYVIVGQDDVDAFAPVVAALAGT